MLRDFIIPLYYLKSAKTAELEGFIAVGEFLLRSHNLHLLGDPASKVTLVK
jgi:hypothetical protein